MLTHTFVSYKNALKLVVYKWKPNWALHTLQLLNSWVKCSFFVCMDHICTARVNHKCAYLPILLFTGEWRKLPNYIFQCWPLKNSDNSIELITSNSNWRMIYDSTPSWKEGYIEYYTYFSMTQLFSHTFAHLTGPSFRLKAKLLPHLKIYVLRKLA